MGQDQPHGQLRGCIEDNKRSTSVQTVKGTSSLLYPPTPPFAHLLATEYYAAGIHCQEIAIPDRHQ